MKGTDETWTPLRVLDWTTSFLLERGVENARLEAEWMLCAATGLERIGLYLNFDKPLSDTELAGYRSMVARRGRREPLQHILGSQEFDGLEFIVTPSVLIPRHDTELLVTTAAEKSPDCGSLLDVGTGSGCIAISLAKRLSAATVTATDISPDALTVARQNARQHSAAVQFLLGSFYQPVAGRCFDLIVSNPPYIPTADIERLQPEVKNHDPRSALDGGADGLDAYRQLIKDGPEYLNAGGWLLLEAGAGQGGELSRLLYERGFDDILSMQDNAGHQRVLGGRWHGKD